jgi:hypothetical protein
MALNVGQTLCDGRTKLHKLVASDVEMENNFRCMQQKTANQKLHKHFSCAIEMQFYFHRHSCMLYACVIMQQLKEN